MLYLDGLVPLEFCEPPYLNNWRQHEILARELEAMLKGQEDYEEYQRSGRPIPLPEGASNSTELNEAQAMAEYCHEFKRHGSNHYEDPAMAREAVRLDLVDKNTLTRPWNEHVEWKERKTLRHECESQDCIDYHNAPLNPLPR